MPRAFITGITGQDGSYLAEFLLERGYEVHGLVRHTSRLETGWLAPLTGDAGIWGRRLVAHYGSLDDLAPLQKALAAAPPDEFYHLAGQSHVGRSLEIPEATCETTGMATVRLLEILRGLPRPPRVFHASSSEIFGQPATSPQDEDTPLTPVNPYGCAKAFATQMTGIYRRIYGLFACNGIFFNHESPRRGENFVTRKICRAAAAIKVGRQKELILGDTSARRDWGHARDYVRGAWLALQRAEADDYVFATGVLHTVADVVEQAFAAVQLDWRDYVKQDAGLFRCVEPAERVGSFAKARRLLDWEPQIPFADLIREMVQSELAWSAKR